MTVYFIAGRGTGAVKIGFTAGDPARRLSDLQCGSPDPLHILGVMPGASRDTEWELHRRFAGSRMHGEWFAPTPDVMRFVRRRCGMLPDWMESHAYEYEPCDARDDPPRVITSHMAAMEAILAGS